MTLDLAAEVVLRAALPAARRRGADTLRRGAQRLEQLSRDSDHFEFFWFPHTGSVCIKTNTRLRIDTVRVRLGGSARFLDEEVANNVVFGAVSILGQHFRGRDPGP